MHKRVLSCEILLLIKTTTSRISIKPSTSISNRPLITIIWLPSSTTHIGIAVEPSIPPITKPSTIPNWIIEFILLLLLGLLSICEGVTETSLHRSLLEVTYWFLLNKGVTCRILLLIIVAYRSLLIEACVLRWLSELIALSLKASLTCLCEKIRLKGILLKATTNGRGCHGFVGSERVSSGLRVGISLEGVSCWLRICIGLEGVRWAGVIRLESEARFSWC